MPVAKRMGATTPVSATGIMHWSGMAPPPNWKMLSTAPAEEKPANRADEDIQESM